MQSVHMYGCLWELQYKQEIKYMKKILYFRCCHFTSEVSHYVLKTPVAL